MNYGAVRKGKKKKQGHTVCMLYPIRWFTQLWFERLPCLSSATRTSFPGRVLTTIFHLRQAPAFPTIMKSSKRLPSTVLPGYSSCKLLVGNTIFLQMPWDLQCIQLVPMSVSFFLAYPRIIYRFIAALPTIFAPF